MNYLVAIKTWKCNVTRFNFSNIDTIEKLKQETNLVVFKAF
ncbi:MAG: hypothetical protein U1E31_02405 [Rickettsiales bacterium]